MALSEYLVALRRRRYAAYEQHPALERVGRAGAGRLDPPGAGIHVLDEIVTAVERISTARTDAENAALHATRAAADTTTEETR